MVERLSTQPSCSFFLQFVRVQLLHFDIGYEWVAHTWPIREAFSHLCVGCPLKYWTSFVVFIFYQVPS